MGKMFANTTTDKGLISKTYQQLMQLNIKKKKKPTQKIGSKFKDAFPKKTYRWP